MGNCSANAAALNREVHDKLSRIDANDVNEMANLLKDGWALYEKLNSNNRNDLKKLTKQHFKTGDEVPKLVSVASK